MRKWHSLRRVIALYDYAVINYISHHKNYLTNVPRLTKSIQLMLMAERITNLKNKNYGI